MSSHHFVKEGQEPALIIADATHLHEAVQLLEWAPLIVVLNKALDDVLNFEIKADAVICRNDEKEDFENRVSHQAPVNIITYHDGEEALQKALDFLISSKQFTVNILTHQPEQYFHQTKGFIN